MRVSITCLLLTWSAAAMGQTAASQPATSSGAPNSPVPQESARVSPESLDPISRPAFLALERKARTGVLAAEYEVGARYAEGLGVKQDTTQAYGWLRKAAEQGDPRAQRRLGELLMKGAGTEPDAQQGIGWLAKSAEAGDAQAQFDVALAYGRGDSVPRDYGKAFPWFFKLAQEGDATAQRTVGYLYQQGWGVAKDTKAASEWWEKAAAQNEPQALANLGLLYLQGEGIEPSTNKALSFFVRASILGNLDAEVLLAKAYASGTGVTRDAQRGRDLLEAAARSGQTEAQFLLGSLLATGGTGVPDYERAAKWLARAAGQGSADAQSILGMFYQQGTGVPNDPIQALKWFYLAAAQGVSEAKARQQELSLFVKPAQLQEARRLADGFQPQPSRPVADDEPAAACALGAEFLIPVSMLGQTKYLVVDTGSTFSVLETTNQSRLGAPLARERVETPFQEGEFDVYASPELWISKRRFAPLWASCGSFQNARTALGGPCDGVLGLLCLEHFVVSFDPDQHRFSLGGTVTDSFKRSALAIPLKQLPNHKLAIEASINGLEPFYFELDTGDDSSLSLTERDWRQVFRQGEPRTSQIYSAGVGEEVGAQKVARIRSLTVGTNQYSNLIASLAFPSETVSRLGQGFFRRHVCAFDFPNQVLYLLPGDHFRDPDERNMSGMYPVRQGERTVVYSVLEGSPAYKAGVRQDDQLISINGQEAASLELSTLQQMLQRRPHAKITVKVKRGEHLLTFAFALKRLI